MKIVMTSFNNDNNVNNVKIDLIERQNNVSFIRIYIAPVTVHFRDGSSQNCDTLNVNIENFQEIVKKK
jgi:hypothetical protein